MLTRFRKGPGFIPVIAVAFLVQRLVFEILAVRSSIPRTAIFACGDDFQFLYLAAGYFLSGQSPYTEKWFIPLPSALYLPLTVHQFPYLQAFGCFQVLNALVIVFSMLVLCRKLKLSPINSVFVMLAVVSYGPAWAIVGEGNLDGLMLVLIVLTCSSSRLVRASALALSVGAKFYSLLVLFVWVLQKRWREIVITGVVLFLLLLPFAAYWRDAFQSVTHRAGAFVYARGNQSPALLFIQAFGIEQKWLWLGCYLAFWFATLLPRLILDCSKRSDEELRWNPLEYLPWMASAPVLVFYYTSVILLPFLALLVARYQDRKGTVGSWFAVAGFALTGFYPWLFAQHQGLGPHEMDLRLVVPIGLSFMLVGGAMTAMDEYRSVDRWRDLELAPRKV